MGEMIQLKWGTVKGWKDLSAESLAALQKWSEGGVEISAMAQKNTEQQKKDLCEAIDSVAKGGGEIWNEWSGNKMTADEAKSYVMEYGI